MKFGPYRLLSQIGVGWDGVAYRARDERTGTEVEVRTLARAKDDAGRWSVLQKRLRIAMGISHPGALRILDVELESEQPFVAVEWLEGDAASGRLSADQVATLGHAWSDLLSTAHRMGLVHGNLSLGSMRGWSSSAIPKIDLTGLQTNDQASIQLTDDPTTDVAQLGALLQWILADSNSDLSELVREMQADDPASRPRMAEVRDRLAALTKTPTLSILAPSAATVANGPRESVGGETVALAVPAEMSTGAATEVRNLARSPSLPELSQREQAGRERLIEQLGGKNRDRDELLERGQLGRYHLIDKLGEGGMGAVYRAVDSADETTVAVKVLSAKATSVPNAVRRFMKEARLLAEVNNPHVTNLLDVNEDDGIIYLVMELVAGQSLQKLLNERKRLDERTALAIMADVAKALVTAHERGVVHRDIKPDNILLQPSAVSGQRSAFQVKLSDFGLARHIVESESLNVTQAGAILGTPHYMAPEQCTENGTVDTRTDIYALGATLFHLLTGRPPFVAESVVALIAMHRNDPAPPVEKFNPQISEALSRVITKSLAKRPDERYESAAAVLVDLERLLRGEPTGIVVHPQLPVCDPKKILHYDWTWELESSPEKLWPYVSNTERLNRAVGLPAVQFTSEADETGGSRRYGKFRKLAMNVVWREHPFEWVEGRRFGVLREYSDGPFIWMMSMCEFMPRSDGGTTLAHRIRIMPRNLLGRTAAAVEVGIRFHRSVDRVYRRTDAALTGKLGDPGLADGFEEATALAGNRLKRLDSTLEKLLAAGVDPTVVERVGDFIAHAPAQDVARIRPVALARRLALDPEQVIAACLHGAREGLLVLHWDLLCPICRIPSEVTDTLRALREHGRCDACNLDYDLDFANSVEMIFRAHPEIRDSELGVFCIGGPVHSPHVVAQVRVAAKERFQLEVNLNEGQYRLRGPQLPFNVDFRVQANAVPHRWELNLSQGPEASTPRSLRAGPQTIIIANDQAHEVVVRIERTAPRSEAVTAARASAHALFRQLFPGEILTPGQLVSVSTTTFLVTRLLDSGDFYTALGDAKAFALMHEHFRILDDCIRKEGGALVKTVGEGVLAVFNDAVAAVRTALELWNALASSSNTSSLRLGVALHRGPAMVATLNDHLDYFGTTVNTAWQLLAFGQVGEIIATSAVTADGQVAALLQSRRLMLEVLSEASLPNLVVERIVPRSGI